MTAIRRLVTLALVLLPIAAMAAPKQPWEWTVEERIAARIDPEAARRRVAALATTAAGDPPVRTDAVSGRKADHIDGRRHPELFLPSEVFRNVVIAGVYAEATRAAYQAMHAAGVTRLGLPSDFWNRLGAIAAPYVAGLEAERNLASNVAAGRASANDVAAELRDQRRRTCVDAAAALAAARREFGPAFDRFLYEYGVRTLFVITDTIPTSAELRYAEGGCR